MNPNTVRPVNPIFNDLGPAIGDFDPADIIVDDGRTPPPSNLGGEGTGAPPNVGGEISLTVNPLHNPAGEGPDIDPSLIPVPNGDIGLWSGEDGSDNPFFHTHGQLLPSGMGDVDSGLPNGGPDGIGISAEEAKWVAIWQKQQDDAKKARADWEKKTTLQPWVEPKEDLYKKAADRAAADIDKSEAEVILEAFKDFFKNLITGYSDPDQMGGGEGFDPHAMVDSLLGRGEFSLPNGLGLDMELIGKTLGGHAGAIDKFGDFLKQLGGIDMKGGSGLDGLDSFVSSFGIDGLDAVLKEFLPHIDLDSHAFHAVEHAEPTQPSSTKASFRFSTTSRWTLSTSSDGG